jgi:hypothetical protein
MDVGGGVPTELLIHVTHLFWAALETTEEFVKLCVVRVRRYWLSFGVGSGSDCPAYAHGIINMMCVLQGRHVHPSNTYISISRGGKWLL